MDPDLDPAPDPAFFVIDLRDANANAYYFLKVLYIYIIFQR
jgi:hypothetical protein